MPDDSHAVMVAAQAAVLTFLVDSHCLSIAFDLAASGRLAWATIQVSCYAVQNPIFWADKFFRARIVPEASVRETMTPKRFTGASKDGFLRRIY